MMCESNKLISSSADCNISCFILKDFISSRNKKKPAEKHETATYTLGKLTVLTKEKNDLKLPHINFKVTSVND